MRLTKAWHVVRFVVVLALLLTAVPMAVTAQSAVMSSMIRGELTEQFAKHYLGLRVIDPAQQMIITMDYSPQDNQDLDAASGFYVFESTGFAHYIAGTPAPQSALGIGSLQQVDGGPKQKIHTISTPDSTFSLVAFNDTKTPLAYTLTGENVVFVDESGEQIVDARPLASTSPPPAAEPVAAASAVVLETPGMMRASELSGELPQQFAKHYFALETTDTTVSLQLHVQPQDNSEVQEKVNAFLLTESQLKAYVDGMDTDLYANNTTILQVPQDSTSLTKLADFTIDGDRVGTRFTVIVGNDSTMGASYTLEVEGGILEDGSAQSRMAQEPATDAMIAAPQTPAAEPAAAASAVVLETPGMMRASELSGELPQQFAKHYFALETTDTTVSLQLHVHPQDNSEVQEKVNAFLLTESQLKAYVDGTDTDLYANNTTILQVPQDSASLTKLADFMIDGDRVGTRFTVIVGNDSTMGASYTLEVEGGILEDGSAQSRMAQESATDAITAASTAPITASATSITRGSVYTVEQGDTLGTIASRAFGNSDYWSAICSGNALANCDIIEVGDVLTIPTMAQADAILANAATQETAALEVTTETEMAMTEPIAEAETTEEPTEAMAAESVPTGDLGEVAKTSAQLEVFLLLLEMADLFDSIASGGPFTVFAPTDEAFAAIPRETLSDLLALDNRTLLADVLQFHVLPGQLMAADLAPELVQPTLQGSTVEVSTAEDGALTIGGATIIESDLVATNGVIHIIDQVLLPAEN